MNPYLCRVRKLNLRLQMLHSAACSFQLCWHLLIVLRPFCTSVLFSTILWFSLNDKQLDWHFTSTVNLLFQRLWLHQARLPEIIINLCLALSFRSFSFPLQIFYPKLDLIISGSFTFSAMPILTACQCVKLLKIYL